MYRRQGPRLSPRKEIAKRKIGCLGRPSKHLRKKRELKGIGEKERYTQLIEEFQRMARRAEKAFLTDQCNEIEDNNRMRKNRDFSRKLEITRGHVIQDGHNKGHKRHEPNRSRRY